MVLRVEYVDHLPYPFFRSVNTGIMLHTGITKSGVSTGIVIDTSMIDDLPLIPPSRFVKSGLIIEN